MARTRSSETIRGNTHTYTSTGQPKRLIRGAADRFTMHAAELEIEEPSWRFSLDARLCVEPTRRHQTRLRILDGFRQTRYRPHRAGPLNPRLVHQQGKPARRHLTARAAIVLRGMSMRTEAEVLARLIFAGLLEPRSAVSWAEMEIQKPNAPLETLADLAAADRLHPSDIVHLLNEVPGAVDSDALVRGLYGRLAQLLRAKPDYDLRIIRFLYAMARDGELPDEAARADIYQLDDDFEHVLPGASRDNARQALTRFLERYAPDA
jgi:hypothetical protein